MTSALELDVRSILRNGGDPFGAIMGAVTNLAPGQSFTLFATFRPEPLLAVMAAKGFDHAATQLADGDWQVVFSPHHPAGSSASDPETWPDPTHYLDCTEMAPPQPMARIMGKLTTMAEGEVLFALLAGEPVLLFAELEAHGHAWVGDFDAEGMAYRMMVRAGPRRK